MFDRRYRDRLKEDLPAWREKGWVTDTGAEAILASLHERSGPGFGLAAVVAVLGTVLLGFGLFALIGANWDYMPRIFRFGLLTVCLGLAYAAAAALDRRGFPKFADAAVLLACFVFAAAIALVGQTYHLAGDFADAVLLWLAGTLVAAFATRSVSATVLAAAGASYWIWIVTYDKGVPLHWGGLAAVLACCGLSILLDSRLARSVCILALGFWIVCTGLALNVRTSAEPADLCAVFAALGLLFWAGGLALAQLTHWPRLARFGVDLQTPGLAGFLASAASLQLALDVTTSESAQGASVAVSSAVLMTAVGLGAFVWRKGALRALDLAVMAVLGLAVIGLAAWSPQDEFTLRLVLGIVVIAIALWWVSLGHEGHATGSRIGLLAFGAEVLYLYGVTLGTLLDTALSFFAGGILFIGLSVLLMRFNRKLASAKVAA